MHRYRLRRLIVLIAAATWVGCSFTDGRPWGRVDAQPAAQSLESSRALPDDMNLERATLEAEIFLESVSTSSGGSGGTFSPANPPEGYTLCHNGHCHSDGGELVPYEEVRAEMASGGGTSTSTIGSWTASIDLRSGDSVSLPKVDVDEETSIDRVTLEATNLVLEGTVESDGDTIPFEAQLGQFELGTLEGLGLSVGPDQPFEQTVDLCMRWSNEWFEQIDVSGLERKEGTIRLTRILNADATTKLVGAIQQAELESSSCS
jgi:hypothetical protein